jgi:flagellar M-ring protein FliF
MAETIPGTALAVTTAPAASRPSLLAQPWAAPMRDALANPAVRRMAPAIGAVGVVALAAIIWSMVSAAPQKTLFAGLADEDKAAMVDALGAAGIAYEVDRASGAITVGEDAYYQARMLLAAEGLPKGATEGNDLIASLPMGASRAVEGERIRGAREADLARTIEAMDAVDTARVHLAVSEPSAFVRARSETAASVMIGLAAGRALSDNQVQAIVHLVASSVPQLTPDDVAVVDQRGRLLSQSGGASGASDRQLATGRAIEQEYRDALAALLSPIVGADNYSAEVTADVDFAEVQSTREGYPQNPGVLTRETGEMSSDSSAGAPGGIPGALANQPPDPAQVANAPGGVFTTAGGTTGPATGRRSENYARSFAIGREVSVIRQQSPSLKRLSVAVVLRNPATGRPRSTAELREIERVIKGALGFDAARGDVVVVSARRFTEADAAATANWWEAEWLATLARHLTAIIIVLILVFGLARPLLRRFLAPPVAPAAGEAEPTANSVEDSRRRAAITVEMIESSPEYEARAALIRGFVKQDPPRAALVVRDLIRSDAGKAASNG